MYLSLSLSLAARALSKYTRARRLSTARSVTTDDDDDDDYDDVE